MSNTSKGRGVKGSKYWMQTVVENNEYRLELEHMIGEPLMWISPLAGFDKTYDEYELQHQVVLDILGISKEDAKKIFAFWPKRQPQWDGIAICNETNTLYIVEAKAHLQELKSKLSASNKESVRLITDSMKFVHDEVYPEGDFSKWLDGYYQLANRLTFLYYLNQCNFPKVKKIKLVLLNFVEDHTYRKVNMDDWKKHYKDVLKMMVGTTAAPDDVELVYFNVKDKT